MSAVCAGSLAEVLLDAKDAYGFPAVEYRGVEDLCPGDLVRGVRDAFVRVARVRRVFQGGGVVPLCRYFGLVADGTQYVFACGGWRMLRSFIDPVTQKCPDIWRVEVESSSVEMIFFDGVACAAPPKQRDEPPQEVVDEREEGVAEEPFEEEEVDDEREEEVQKEETHWPGVPEEEEEEEKEEKEQEEEEEQEEEPEDCTPVLLQQSSFRVIRLRLRGVSKRSKRNPKSVRLARTGL